MVRPILHQSIVADGPRYEVWRRESARTQRWYFPPSPGALQRSGSFASTRGTFRGTTADLVSGLKAWQCELSDEAKAYVSSFHRRKSGRLRQCAVFGLGRSVVYFIARCTCWFKRSQPCTDRLKAQAVPVLITLLMNPDPGVGPKHAPHCREICSR